MIQFLTNLCLHVPVLLSTEGCRRRKKSRRQRRGRSGTTRCARRSRGRTASSSPQPPPPWCRQPPPRSPSTQRTGCWTTGCSPGRGLAPISSVVMEMKQSRPKRPKATMPPKSSGCWLLRCFDRCQLLTPTPCMWRLGAPARVLRPSLRLRQRRICPSAHRRGRGAGPRAPTGRRARRGRCAFHPRS